MLTIAPEAAGKPLAVAAKRGLRVAIFGGYGIGNFGNDASLEAVLTFLRTHHPSVEITAICTNPAEVTRRYSVPAISTQLKPKGWLRRLDTLLLRQPSTWTNWVHCLSALGRFDAVIVAGTGVFDDFRDTPLGWPSRLLRWSIAARARGVRMAFLSVGAGPILNPISRVLMKSAAQLAQHRSYRDEGSRTYMQNLGVNEAKSPVLPDLAFLLPAPADAAALSPLTVGVGIMNYRGWRDSDGVYQNYIDSNAAFITWLEQQGHKVRILIGQTPTDLVAVRDVEAKLGRALITKQEESMSSFHDAMAAIAETNIVVASRYHVQIAALKLRRPLISLSYAPKNDALLADAGLEGFSQDVHHIDLERLKSQFQTLASDRARYAQVVDERVTAMEAQLSAALHDLALPRD